MNVVWGNQVLGQMGKQFSLKIIPIFQIFCILFLFSMWFFLLLRFKCTYLSLPLCECEKAKPIDKPKKLPLNHKNNIQRSLWFFSWLFFSSSVFKLHSHFTPLRKGALRPTVKITLIEVPHTTCNTSSTLFYFCLKIIQQNIQRYIVCGVRQYI